MSFHLLNEHAIRLKYKFTGRLSHGQKPIFFYKIIFRTLTVEVYVIDPPDSDKNMKKFENPVFDRFFSFFCILTGATWCLLRHFWICYIKLQFP